MQLSDLHFGQDLGRCDDTNTSSGGGGDGTETVTVMSMLMSLNVQFENFEIY